MTPRIGSLCSGYGGLELGLMAVVGGTVAWHAENDPHPSKVLAARFPDVPNLDDITTVDWAQVPRVDWLTAGYPCQPDSLAGKGLSEDDERWIWPDIARAVGVLRPRHLLLENVPGHFVRGFRTVLGSLTTLGYDAQWTLVRASAVGAPHKRERLFVVATDTAQRGRRGAEGQQRGVRAAERLAAAATDTRGEAVRVGTGLRESGPGRLGWGRSDDHSSSSLDADATGDGRDEGRPELAGQLGRPDAAEHGPAAAHTDGDGLTLIRGQRPDERDPDRRSDQDIAWGDYEPAIRRWEAVTGRPVPCPTEPGGRGGRRLNPRLNEWMMGLPDGWVTDILPRSPALKCIGNGVVPQQAAAAVRTLLSLEGEVAV